MRDLTDFNGSMRLHAFRTLVNLIGVRFATLLMSLSDMETVRTMGILLDVIDSIEDITSDMLDTVSSHALNMNASVSVMLCDP